MSCIATLPTPVSEAQQQKAAIHGASPRTVNLVMLAQPLLCLPSAASLLDNPTLQVEVLGSGAVAGAQVLVTYPNGSRQGATTGSSGSVSFPEKGQGVYSVAVSFSHRNVGTATASGSAAVRSIEGATVFLRVTGGAQLLITLGVSTYTAPPANSSVANIASNGLWYNNNYHIFFAAGRFWVFYRDTSTTQILYQSSADGLSWAAPVSLSPNIGASYGGGVIYVQALNLVYYCFPDADYGVYWRYGTPNPDGSITWANSEQSFTISVVDGFNVPGFDVDVNGNLWTATLYGSPSLTGWEVRMNGTLVADIDLSTSSLESPLTIKCSLGNANNVAVFGAVFPSGVYATKLFYTTDGGSTWNSASDMPTPFAPFFGSAVVVGNRVYIVHAGLLGYGSLKFLTYDIGSGSASAETTLATIPSPGANNSMGCSIATDGTSTLLVVYTDNSSNIYALGSANLGSSWGGAETIMSGTTFDTFGVSLSLFSVLAQNSVVVIAWAGQVGGNNPVYAGGVAY